MTFRTSKQVDKLVSQEVDMSTIELTTKSVNFIKILQAAKVFRAAFLCLWLKLVFFWRKEINAKTAHKTFVKLTAS